MRVLCVSGPSGSGKTTLMERLLPLLPLPPTRVALLKHTHHRLDWHPVEKDSTRMWETGAAAVGVVDPAQSAFFHRREDEAPADRSRPAWSTLDLVAACHRLPGAVELVLAEGWSGARAPRIWMTGAEPGAGDDPPPVTRAVVTVGDRLDAWRAWAGEGRSAPGGADSTLAVLARDEVEPLAERVLRWAVPVAELPLGPTGRHGPRPT